MKTQHPQSRMELVPQPVLPKSALNGECQVPCHPAPRGHLLPGTTWMSTHWLPHSFIRVGNERLPQALCAAPWGPGSEKTVWFPPQGPLPPGGDGGSITDARTQGSQPVGISRESGGCLGGSEQQDGREVTPRKAVVGT